MRRPLLVLAGPTAVGKTTLSIKLAGLLRTEIINADSRQIYKLMDIGTAKPTPREQKEVPHHMIDLVYPDEPFNAVQYQNQARTVIDSMHKQGHLPFMVGGSGLYIRSATQGIFQGPGANPVIRERLRLEAEKNGSISLYEKLVSVDPESSSKIHPHDLFRLIRALEVYEITGQTISSLRKDPSLYVSPYDPLIIGLSRERKELYRRIEERCQKMLEAGLHEEVRNLLDLGYREDLTAFQGPGYTQAIGYLRGLYPLEKALHLMQRETKRYAKRQFTWFNHIPNIVWFHLEGEGAETDAQLIKRIMELIERWMNRLP